MSDDLYQAAILDRARSGERAGRLERPDASATIDNPLCGDRVTIDLKLDGARISDIAQHVRGCALCQAAAATIARHAIGQTVESMAEAAEALRDMLKRDAAAPAGAWSELSMFLPVRAYKSRHDCVLLPFETVARAVAASRVKAS